MCCFFVLSGDNFSERAWPETCFESGTLFSLDGAVKQHREFGMSFLCLGSWCSLGALWGYLGPRFYNTIYIFEHSFETPPQ